jgi:hypothetical protein
VTNRPTALPTEIVAIITPQNHTDRYHHTDADGDRLLIAPASTNDEPGVFFRTDPNGSSVPLTELPALLAQMQRIADAANANANADQHST